MPRKKGGRYKTDIPYCETTEEYNKLYRKDAYKKGKKHKTSRDYLQRKKERLKDEATRFIDLELEFTPKKAQAEIIKLTQYMDVKRIVVNICRQYGKSFVCRYLALQWLSKLDMTLGYITQTSRLAKDIYKKFLNLYPKELIKANDGKDLIIELINGSKVIFFSVEQTHTIRGFTLDYLIWDEVSHCREYTPDGEHLWYNIISPLLDARGKCAVFISTPNGKQGFFYELYQRAINRERGYAYVECSIWQDETKDKKWIEEKKAEYPELAWKQEYECQFLEGGLSYFHNYQELFCDEEFDFNLNMVGGVDFSSVGTDDTVLTLMNERKQTMQFIINGTLDEKYAQISALLNKYQTKLRYCLFESNSIGAVMGNEIKKMLPMGVRNKIDFIYTSNSSKNDYIDKLALDIEQKNISFMRDNDVLREELSTFTYKVSKTGLKVFNALDGYKDDAVISVALANLAYERKMKKSGTKMMVIHT